MDTTEMAWAAGFFDGEGTAYASRNNSGRNYLVLTLSNTNMEALKRFQRVTNGRLYPMAKSNWGTKPVWTVHISRRETVAAFLANIYPLLCSEKRAACDRARALEEANPSPIPYGERNWPRGPGSKPRRATAAVGE